GNVALDRERSVPNVGGEGRPGDLRERVVWPSVGVDLPDAARPLRQAVGAGELTVQVVEAVVFEVDNDDVLELVDAAVVPTVVAVRREGPGRRGRRGGCRRVSIFASPCDHADQHGARERGSGHRAHSPAMCHGLSPRLTYRCRATGGGRTTGRGRPP